jgi:hypothetical protein
MIIPATCIPSPSKQKDGLARAKVVIAVPEPFASVTVTYTVPPAEEGGTNALINVGET